MIPAYLSKLLITTAVTAMAPTLFDEFKKFFSSNKKEEPEVIPEKTERKRTSGWIPDNSIWHEGHWLFANEMHTKVKKANDYRHATNSHQRFITQKELCDKLNEIMGLHKSTTSYRQLWDGTILLSDVRKSDITFSED